MVTLNNEQATLVLTVMKAIRFNFRLDKGMNYGSSSVHNIFPNELRIIDEITEKISASVK